MDAMFAAAEESERNTPKVPVRDTGKINVSMGFASTDPDSSYHRKDKFKSRIGGLTEDSTLSIPGSQPATNAQGGSLNNQSSASHFTYLTEKYGKEPYGPGGYFNKESPHLNSENSLTQYAKR
jgi:hypothetical protein